MFVIIYIMFLHALCVLWLKFHISYCQ